MIVSLLACTTSPTHDAPGPEVQLRVHDPVRSEVATGRVLFTAFEPKDQENWILLLGGDGRAEWSYRGPAELRSVRAHPSRDGQSVVYVANDLLGEDAGVIVRQPLDGGEPTTTTATAAHHDFVELDGAYVFLEHVFDLVPLPPLPGTSPVATDGIRVVAEGSVAEGEALFDFFEDYPADPWFVCDHMELGGWIEGWHEWTHSNSIVPHPSDDAYLVLARYLDAILKVDATTGEVLWQLGGRDSDFTLGPGAAFVHGHFSHAWGDRLLVFDNGDDHDRDDKQISRVVELAIDEDARTVELVWEHVDPEGLHNLFLGDARRLPGGNTLISWGQHRRISEVTPEGDVVWEISVPDLAVGRVTFWPRGNP